jgi:hypothetical protein
MKMLHFATNESWRSRGRYLLMNAGLRAIDPEKSAFCPISECSQAPTPVSDFDEGPYPKSFERKEPELSVGGENEDRRLLMDKIQRETGKRPHHFTGIDKLKEMVQQLEQPVSV